MKGKIVLISFPFTDLTATKLRPALILYESEKDVVAAFISSKSKNPKTTDILIEENHPEFKHTGLKVASVIKLDKVATISKELLLGEIGEVNKRLKDEINRRIISIYCF